MTTQRFSSKAGKKSENDHDLYELFSAFQKSVRRGYWSTGQALLKETLDFMGEEWTLKTTFLNRLGTMCVEDVSPREERVIKFCLRELFALKRAKTYDYQSLEPVLEKMYKAKKFRLTSFCRAMERAGKCSSGNVPKWVHVGCLQKNHAALKAFWMKHNTCESCLPIYEFFTKEKLYGRKKEKIAFNEADMAAMTAYFWHMETDLNPIQEHWQEPSGAFDLESFPDYVLDKHTRSPKGDKTKVGFVTNGALVNNQDIFFSTDFFHEAEIEYLEQAKREDEEKGVKRRKPVNVVTPDGDGKKQKLATGKHMGENYVNVALPVVYHGEEPIVVCRHVCTKLATFMYRGYVYSKMSEDAIILDTFKEDFGLIRLNTCSEILPFTLQKRGLCSECLEQNFTAHTCSRWTVDNIHVAMHETVYTRMDCIPSAFKRYNSERDLIGLPLADALKLNFLKRENILREYFTISMYRFLFNSTDCNPCNVLVTHMNGEIRLVSSDENGIGQHKNFWFTKNDGDMLKADENFQTLKEVIADVKSVATNLVENGTLENVMIQNGWKMKIVEIFKAQLAKIDSLLDKDEFKERPELFKKLFV